MDVPQDLALRRFQRDAYNLPQWDRRAKTDSTIYKLDILDITVELANEIAEKDDDWLFIVIDALKSRGEAGWNRLVSEGLDKWDPKIKNELIKSYMVPSYGRKGNSPSPEPAGLGD